MITSLQTNTPISSVVHQNGMFKSMPNPQPRAQVEEDSVVHISSPHLMTDEESAAAMADVASSLKTNSSEAVSVHSGLDLSRVMSLLDM